MYEEIDYSGQGIIKLASIFVYVVMMFLFFFIALGIPPEDTYFEDPLLLIVLLIQPFAAFLLGSFLGFITKRSIRISTDRLVFNEETRSITKFGSVYYEGSDTASELVGHIPSACTWILFLLSPIVLVFPLFSTTPFIAGMILAISCGFLYPVGYILFKRAAAIRTGMVKNPLHFRLTKYLTVDNALHTLLECQYVEDVIVKYRRAESELLNLIDNIHVFIVTKTNPVLEIEVTLEKIQNIGLELTSTLEERLTSQQKEETIKVDGTDALLTVKDTGMATLISISYDMNRFSERLALGSAKRNCALLEAILQELTQHISELTILDGAPLYE